MFGRLKGQPVEGLNQDQHCHSERSEESLNSSFRQPEGHSRRCFAPLNMTRQKTLRPYNPSHPLCHLFRERALCAIGIVLHAKVFVDLEQPLLVRDSAQEFLPAGIISKKTRCTGFESPV